LAPLPAVRAPVPEREPAAERELVAERDAVALRELVAEREPVPEREVLAERELVPLRVFEAALLADRFFGAPALAPRGPAARPLPEAMSSSISPLLLGCSERAKGPCRPPRHGPFATIIPATSYSPRELPPKYHRRWRS
jgi:hypothetical protein